MIHPILKKTYVTQRYYAARGIELDPEAARKRFAQDNNIDENGLTKRNFYVPHAHSDYFTALALSCGLTVSTVNK